MVEFKFIEYGTDFGTRDMGQKLRHTIKATLKTALESIDDLTRAIRQIDSSQLISWLGNTRGLSPCVCVKMYKELPSGKLPLGNIVYLCGRKQMM